MQIGEGPEIETESNVSPGIGGGSIKDISKRRGLGAIGENEKGSEGDGKGFRDS